MKNQKGLSTIGLLILVAIYVVIFITIAAIGIPAYIEAAQNTELKELLGINFSGLSYPPTEGQKKILRPLVGQRIYELCGTRDSEQASTDPAQIQHQLDQLKSPNNSSCAEARKIALRYDLLPR